VQTGHTCNTELDLKQIGCKGVEWMYLVQHRDKWRALVNTVMNLRIP